jgi:RND family efflux transporter MFP subunit
MGARTRRLWTRDRGTIMKGGPGIRSVPVAIGVGVVLLLVTGTLMVFRAESGTNKVALSASAKPVTVVEATATTYRGFRTYVGTIEPWVEARIGPQLVSAYVDTVLVRPGAVVKKGDVLAMLDCRNASATSQAVAMQARALETSQKAVASEAARIRGLLDAGFTSPNEAEQKEAQSASEQAQLLAQRAKLLGTSLEVNDCVLRAPFDGEVATRGIDPGAFVRPGSAIVSVVDRSIVRIAADAPEVDFDVVAPGTKVVVHLLATDRDLEATISRRAPAADEITRTVRFELDVPDPEKTIPVGTTGEIRIEVGEPFPALAVPLAAVAVRGSKASLFVVEGNVAHARVLPVQGELGGDIFLAPQLPPGSKIVTEGRALLSDGDRVAAAIDTGQPASSSTVRGVGGKALAKPASSARESL